MLSTYDADAIDGDNRVAEAEPAVNRRSATRQYSPHAESALGVGHQLQAVTGRVVVSAEKG